MQTLLTISRFQTRVARPLVIRFTAACLLRVRTLNATKYRWEIYDSLGAIHEVGCKSNKDSAITAGRHALEQWRAKQRN